MYITEHKSQVRMIRQDDPRFHIRDGFALTPRAMLHILPDCPNHIRQIIEVAVQNGYLKAVANVTERELLFMGLTDSK